MKIEVTIRNGISTNSWKEKYIVETRGKKIIYEKNYRKEVENVKNN